MYMLYICDLFFFVVILVVVEKMKD